MSDGDEAIARVAQAAVEGATAKFAGQEYAVLVVVREIGGTRAKVASNAMGGREAMIRVLREAIDGLSGTRLII